MPSPAQEADLERLLSRAAEECEALRGIWFGSGLPQALRSAIEADGKARRSEPAEVAFVEVSAVTPQGQATTSADPGALECPVVGLSTSSLEDLGSLIRVNGHTGVQLSRLICPVAVFDFTPNGVRVREVRHGLTAADLQRQLPTPLYSGPDLKELGSH
jgi:hypothetical protein